MYGLMYVVRYKVVSSDDQAFRMASVMHNGWSSVCAYELVCLLLWLLPCLWRGKKCALYDTMLSHGWLTAVFLQDSRAIQGHENDPENGSYKDFWMPLWTVAYLVMNVLNVRISREMLYLSGSVGMCVAYDWVPCSVYKPSERYSWYKNHNARSAVCGI
jgi:hypothetical protein